MTSAVARLGLVLALLMLAGSLPAGAQAARKVYRVGFLGNTPIS